MGIVVLTSNFAKVSRSFVTEKVQQLPVYKYTVRFACGLSVSEWKSAKIFSTAVLKKERVEDIYTHLHYVMHNMCVHLCCSEKGTQRDFNVCFAKAGKLMENNRNCSV